MVRGAAAVPVTQSSGNGPGHESDDNGHGDEHDDGHGGHGRDHEEDD